MAAELEECLDSALDHGKQLEEIAPRHLTGTAWDVVEEFPGAGKDLVVGCRLLPNSICLYYSVVQLGQIKRKSFFPQCIINLLYYSLGQDVLKATALDANLIGIKRS